ncbi:hypothetical protein BU23DRAFT_571283 [Bimuria novae-zelandiae CBS 107.79]|uniref:Uncharacterized protein n=1 Tax=Bimuria novae-zelandiae CBS 107.79 TaxID=1447943 RepID=A0A6A5UXN9_9PLEO|nr:hypothetical protein BU23DRAFT_571283 [Bimuria novae-zelandiae CBS 107.79]
MNMFRFGHIGSFLVIGASARSMPHVHREAHNFTTQGRSSSDVAAKAAVTPRAESGNNEDFEDGSCSFSVYSFNEVTTKPSTKLLCVCATTTHLVKPNVGTDSQSTYFCATEGNIATEVWTAAPKATGTPGDPNNKDWSPATIPSSRTLARTPGSSGMSRIAADKPTFGAAAAWDSMLAAREATLRCVDDDAPADSIIFKSLIYLHTHFQYIYTGIKDAQSLVNGDVGIFVEKLSPIMNVLQAATSQLFNDPVAFYPLLDRGVLFEAGKPKGTPTDMLASMKKVLFGSVVQAVWISGFDPIFPVIVTDKGLSQGDGSVCESWDPKSVDLDDVP